MFCPAIGHCPAAPRQAGPPRTVQAPTTSIPATATVSAATRAGTAASSFISSYPLHVLSMSHVFQVPEVLIDEAGGAVGHLIP